MAMRKMRKAKGSAKTVRKPMAAPTKVFAKMAKRPAEEDQPRPLGGGMQPGKLKMHKQRERRLKGVMI